MRGLDKKYPGARWRERRTLAQSYHLISIPKSSFTSLGAEVAEKKSLSSTHNKTIPAWKLITKIRSFRRPLSLYWAGFMAFCAEFAVRYNFLSTIGGADQVVRNELTLIHQKNGADWRRNRWWSGPKTGGWVTTLQTLSYWKRTSMRATRADFVNVAVNQCCHKKCEFVHFAKEDVAMGLSMLALIAMFHLNVSKWMNEMKWMIMKTD